MPVWKNKGCSLLLCVLSCAAVLSGCSFVMDDSSDEKAQIQSNGSDYVKKESSADTAIEDNDMLYVNDEDTSVVTMYLTVRQGNAAENTNHTWEELNGHSVYYYEDLGIERYQVEGILQAGDENGPVAGELGYGAMIPNAIVSIRGQSSSTAAVKSYKIEIKDGKGAWREQQTINLNKHVYDGVGFRNKLCYDLMEELPGMISLRTQFVHLYVKDETAGADTGFVDYGLYTQVEQPNKTFLENHGLDRFGHLYKLNVFEFYRYEDLIKLKSDAGYDEAAFNEILESKGNDDHSKLIEMLEDVNNYAKPVEEVFGKWFDEENFFSWMAFHILVGNTDTQSRNTLMYSPTNLDKWYFISWDNDGALKLTQEKLEDAAADNGWQYGVSNYWGNRLIQRVLKSDDYRQKLEDKIEEYRGLLAEEKLAEMITGYSTLVREYKNQLPDKMTSRLTDQEYLQVCEGMPKEIEENYQLYKQSLESPMPFYIGAPTEQDGKFLYSWDNAYDFDDETITYTFELAKDYTFENPVIRQEGIAVPGYQTDGLEPGQYFIRITAENESGYRQHAFDYYRTDEGVEYGIKCFYVLKDGSIEEDTYEK